LLLRNYEEISLFDINKQYIKNHDTCEEQKFLCAKRLTQIAQLRYTVIGRLQ